MKFDELLQLVEAVSKSELTELKYEKDDEKLCLKKQNGEVKIQQVLPQAPVPAHICVPGVVPQPGIQPVVPGVHPAAPGETIVPGAAPAADVNLENAAAGANTAEAAAAGQAAKLTGKVVKSPLVGTFYAAPAEDAAPYVKAGDTVKEGQILAIVEAMKLMNEIESEYSGTISEILVENGEAVEYGQPLFVIE